MNYYKPTYIHTLSQVTIVANDKTKIHKVANDKFFGWVRSFVEYVSWVGGLVCVNTTVKDERNEQYWVLSSGTSKSTVNQMMMMLKREWLMSVRQWFVYLQTLPLLLLNYIAPFFFMFIVYIIIIFLSAWLWLIWFVAVVVFLVFDSDDLGLATKKSEYVFSAYILSHKNTIWVL